jgi:hypothetical protein
VATDALGAEGVLVANFGRPAGVGRTAVLVAALIAAGGCTLTEAPPPAPPPPAYTLVDFSHVTSVRKLGAELGMRVKEDPVLHTLALEEEYGRIVFLDGSDLIVVDGKSLRAEETLRISGGDLPLRSGDAAKIRAAWREVVAEQRPREVVSPPPVARAAAPRSPGAAGLPEWRVPLKRAWRGILIHHSATDSGNMALIDKYHREVNGWLGIGYDFLIDNGSGGPDGFVETTFRWKQQIQGAHAGSGMREHNEHWVGICLVGDFNRSRPSRAQMASLKKLIAFLQDYCDIPEGNIRFHRDVRDTDCPGAHFPVREILRDAPRAR